MERWSAEAANKKPGEAGSSETNSKVPDLAGPPMDETDTLTRVSLLRKLFRLLPYAPSTAWKFQDLFVEEAERLETAGDLPGAVHAYRVAIPFNPQNDRPIRALEKALSKSSPAEQRGVWDAAFKDNPGIALVAALCGAARAAAGDTAGAREAFDTARRLAPEDWYYCVLAADTFAAAGAWDDAIAAYEHALTLNPKLDYLNGRLESAKGAANRPPGAQAP
jgi:tetratricopeptide (TPR) repeat protein